MVSHRSFRDIRQVFDYRIVSCERIVSHALDEIGKTEHHDLFQDLYSMEAIARTRLIDPRISGDKSFNPAGIVASIKKVICTKDRPVKSDSGMLHEFIF